VTPSEAACRGRALSAIMRRNRVEEIIMMQRMRALTGNSRPGAAPRIGKVDAT